MAAMEDPKELEKLQEQIQKGTEETKSYLASLKTKLAEYDETYSVSETATSYLQAGIDRAHKSVDELKELGETLKEKSKSTSAPVVGVAKASFSKVSSALEALKDSGRSYDEKFRASVTGSVDSVKGGVSSASTTVSSSIEHIVVATREKTGSSFEQLKETLFSAGHGAYVVAGGMVSKAEQLDGQYGVTGTVAGVVGSVAGTVTDLDRKLGVSAAAMKMDEKVTGGMGVGLVNKGVVLVNDSMEYVTGALQQAKMSAAEVNSPADQTPPKFVATETTETETATETETETKAAPAPKQL